MAQALYNKDVAVIALVTLGNRQPLNPGVQDRMFVADVEVMEVFKGPSKPQVRQVVFMDASPMCVFAPPVNVPLQAQFDRDETRLEISGWRFQQVPPAVVEELRRLRANATVKKD